MNPVTKNHHYLKRLLFSSRSLAVLCCAASVALLPLPKATAATSSMEYYHYNHQGSLLEVYDGATNKRLLSQAWSPWGERQVLHAATGDRGNIASLLAKGLPVRRGYTGHKTLLSTGLTFAGDTRLYDARLKRFLNSDNRTTGGIRGQNRYSYAYNNPMTYVDPDGHMPTRSRSPSPNARNVMQRVGGGVVNTDIAGIIETTALAVGRLIATIPRSSSSPPVVEGQVLTTTGYREGFAISIEISAANTIRRNYRRYRAQKVSLEELNLRGRLFRTARHVEQTVIRTAVARLRLPARAHRRGRTIFNRVFDLSNTRPHFNFNDEVLGYNGGHVYEVGHNMAENSVAVHQMEDLLDELSDIELGDDFTYLNERDFIVENSFAHEIMIKNFSVCYGLLMAIKTELPDVYQQCVQLHPGSASTVPNFDNIQNWDIWPQEQHFQAEAIVRLGRIQLDERF